MAVQTLLSDSQGLAAPPRWNRRRKVRYGLAGAALVGAGLVMVVLGRWPMVTVVETGRSAEYPYLEAARYAELPPNVVKAAVSAGDRLPGWTLSSTDLDEGILHFDVTHSILRLESEVSIRIRRLDDVTLVDVRSESHGYNRRIGDFGQNARNIRKFLKELDRSMASGAPSP